MVHNYDESYDVIGRPLIVTQMSPGVVVCVKITSSQDELFSYLLKHFYEWV